MEQIVQIISFTIPNDSTFERGPVKGWQKMENSYASHQETKRLDTNALGARLPFFSQARPVLWANIDAADAFRASPTFETTLTWIAISSLTIHCVSLKGTISTQGPTEMMTLFFPASTSQEDFLTFESQVGSFTAELLSADSPHMLPESVAHGWTIHDDQTGQQEIKACVVFIRWYDLDRMYNVKQDKTSLFNNLLVPLLNEASDKSTAALYTRLNNVRIEKFGCVVM